MMNAAHKVFTYWNKSAAISKRQRFSSKPRRIAASSPRGLPFTCQRMRNWLLICPGPTLGLLLPTMEIRVYRQIDRYAFANRADGQAALPDLRSDPLKQPRVHSSTRHWNYIDPGGRPYSASQETMFPNS